MELSRKQAGEKVLSPGWQLPGVGEALGRWEGSAQAPRAPDLELLETVGNSSQSCRGSWTHLPKMLEGGRQRLGLPLGCFSEGGVTAWDAGVPTGFLEEVALGQAGQAVSMF